MGTDPRLAQVPAGAVSPEAVMAAQTPAGGWTRATLAAWGVPWPPPRGWRKRLTQGADDSARTVTPLQLEILLWYHARANDYRDGDFSASAVRSEIDALRDQSKMIEAVPKDEPNPYSRTYRLTERGERFVGAALSVPLPYLSGAQGGS